MIAFISGHLTLTVEEFLEHYVNQIDDALRKGCTFVVGDASGADLMAQNHLWRNGGSAVVYHMFEKPRCCAGSPDCHFPTCGGFSSDEERDAAMTAASNFDIAWVRPGSRKNNGTAKNLARRK